MTWDRQSPRKLKASRDAAVKHQVVDLVGPCAPFWRQQLSLVGLSPKSINGLAALSRIPSVGERDVCPDGDPAAAARMVLQTDERGFVMRSSGYQMRSAYLRRLFSTASYRRRVDAVIRPTSFHEGGLAMRYPIASTRGDLDLIARAGYRLMRVLGVGRQDVIAVTLSDTLSMESVALRYAGIGAGCPIVETAGDLDALARAITVLPVTVLVGTPGELMETVEAFAMADISLATITTVILIDGIDNVIRSEMREALFRAGSSAAVLFAWGPRDGRVLYGECRESVTQGNSAGLHTYPDLDVVQIADPESGETLPDASEGEIVVTQLGFWGSALLRWRTGSISTHGIDKTPCPGCRRVVARITGEVFDDALAAPLNDELVDLRVVAGSLIGRPDLRSWRIEANPAKATVTVHISTGREGGDQVAATVQRDIKRASGVNVTNVVLHDELGPLTNQPGRISKSILVHGR